MVEGVFDRHQEHDDRNDEQQHAEKSQVPCLRSEFDERTFNAPRAFRHEVLENESAQHRRQAIKSWQRREHDVDDRGERHRRKQRRERERGGVGETLTMLERVRNPLHPTQGTAQNFAKGD
ncbi:MAG: hypothetical protein OXE81_06695 [Gammaproteobacteria bacterium]|nr:hypothetical protein [Gammaproteobacteria bacterium]MCY4277509.1 hypothetical protein [Gammaproteobacteria bacterium]